MFKVCELVNRFGQLCEIVVVAVKIFKVCEVANRIIELSDSKSQAQARRGNLAEEGAKDFGTCLLLKLDKDLGPP